MIADELDALADEILVCDSMPYYADKLRALSAAIRQRERECVAEFIVIDRHRGYGGHKTIHWHNQNLPEGTKLYAAPPSAADDAVLKDAVDAIVRDLSDRSGMGWDQIDDDIKSEIRASWTNCICAALAQRTAATEGKS